MCHREFPLLAVQFYRPIYRGLFVIPPCRAKISECNMGPCKVGAFEGYLKIHETCRA